MRRLATIIIAALALIAPQEWSWAGDLLTNPDPTSVALLQYKMAGVAPPFDDMAEFESRSRKTDEFHRGDVIRQIGAGLRAKFAALEGVRQFTINLGSHFAEYDAANGEYDFDITDGTYVPYSVFGKTVQIALTNGTNAQIWKLSAKNAEDALRKNRGDRFATLVLVLEPLPSASATEGEPATLNARIVRYDIIANITNARLGSVAVAP